MVFRDVAIRNLDENENEKKSENKNKNTALHSLRIRNLIASRLSYILPLHCILSLPTKQHAALQHP